MLRFWQVALIAVAAICLSNIIALIFPSLDAMVINSTYCHIDRKWILGLLLGVGTVIYLNVQRMQEEA
jgi:hypothetical protein